MTDAQRELARHALGLPNKRNTTYRNHYCIGPGSPDHAEWESLVTEGYAIQRRTGLYGGDDLFHLTWSGAKLALDHDEKLDAEEVRRMIGLGQVG